jgi:hypothetical protein
MQRLFTKSRPIVKNIYSPSVHFSSATLPSSSLSSTPQFKNGTRNALIYSLFPLAAFGLGTWQVYRLRWKQDLIQSIKEAASADPIILDSNVIDR